MVEIYHNSRCRKSRSGLQYLQDHGVEFEVVEYLKEPMDSGTLADLLKKLGKKPTEMIRTQEAIYKSDFKGKDFSDDQWIDIMVANPKLIKRPIVVDGDKAIWADPADVLNEFFK